MTAREKDFQASGIFGGCMITAFIFHYMGLEWGIGITTFLCTLIIAIPTSIILQRIGSAIGEALFSTEEVKEDE